MPMPARFQDWDLGQEQQLARAFFKHKVRSAREVGDRLVVDDVVDPEQH